MMYDLIKVKIFHANINKLYVFAKRVNRKESCIRFLVVLKVNTSSNILVVPLNIYSLIFSILPNKYLHNAIQCNTNSGYPKRRD